MSGFLGTRADFFSDLLLLALALVVPALVLAVWLGRRGYRRAHQLIMGALVAVLVSYVVVYEANMMWLGGLSYLSGVITMAPTPYFTMVAVHVAIGCAALILGVWSIRRGRAVLQAARERRTHTRVAWWGVGMLGLSSVTGVVIYCATFVV